MAPDIISISIPKGLRVPGEQVSGVLNLNVALVKEKGVEELTVSLRGEVNTWITTWQSTGNSSYSVTHRNKESLFETKSSLWKVGDSLPPHASGIASFPFTFTFPNGVLPPSFYGGTTQDGGAVIYYVHAVGVRQQWYKRNIRVDEVFPVIPFDTSSASFCPLPAWTGDWNTHQNSEKVRKGVFSHSGLVTAAILLPSMPTIPLFKLIPIRIKVTCRSKPLSLSAANDPNSFEFPRNPKVTDVDLTLRSHGTIHHTRGTYRGSKEFEDDLGLQAGFGLPEDIKQRENWGKDIQVTTSPPVWTLDNEDLKKGFWSEEVTFSSHLFLRCPPSIRMPTLNTSMSLVLVIDFPGMGNKIKVKILDLPLTSGIPPPGWRPTEIISSNVYGASNPQSLSQSQTPLGSVPNLPPPTWSESEKFEISFQQSAFPIPQVPESHTGTDVGTEHRSIHDLDLPPSYFEVVLENFASDDSKSA